ncbi:MAG TPA: TraR/DksA C4-type zinc finger protein [Caldilineaceae bacterium]|nr:TraR/DksA C4-type zinc finger protein [Caldilineaceae bacterium]
MSDPARVALEKERLLQEQAQLLEELKSLRELMQAEVDIEPDEGDAEIFEREKNAALIAVLEAKLQDILTALRSIEKGNYGICTRCGKPIEPGRLEVKPDATLCVKCQEEVERLSRRGRPQRQIQW